MNQPQYIPLPSEIDPDEPVVSMILMECRSCGERSPLLRNDTGVYAGKWDADHAGKTGHRRFYVWSVRRQASQVG
jgi:hypothetical protein